jgi:hypothetical protein
MKYGSTMMRVAMSSMFTTILKVTPFMPRSVGDLLWGYRDPLLDLAKDLMPPGQTPPFDKFGFLYEASTYAPYLRSTAFSPLFGASI